LIGEQLRRFGDIPRIQQEFTNNKPEILKLKVDIENAMGMSLDMFLDNIDSIRTNRENDIEQQLTWLKNNHKKYSMNEETTENERIIRSGFSISKVVANSQNLISYLQALKTSLSFSNKVFNTSSIEQPLYDSIMINTGRDMLTYGDEWNAYYSLKKDVIDASFLSDIYSNFIFNNDSNVNTIGNKTTFDMGNIKDRTEFVMFMPDYVRFLKTKFPNNKFVQQLKYNSTRDGLEYIEFRNNLSMDSTEKSIIQDDFAKLPENVKELMRVYQFVTYGFRYKNGSYSEMTDTIMEGKFSNWVKTFTPDRIIQNFDEIMKSAAPVYPELIGLRDNIKNGAKIFKASVLDEIDPNMYVYKGTGEFEAENYDILTNPSPRWMNNIVMDSSYSTLPVIRGIELEDLIKLRNGDSGSIKVRNYRYKMVPKTWIDKKIKEGGYYNKFNLYSGAMATTVDGTIVKVFSGDNKMDLLVYPIDKSGNIIKASAISYNIRKTSSDIMSIITDKLQTAFPNIQIEYVNSDTSLYPSLLGYISNGKVYLNIDKMEPGTPFHEIVGHIFVDYLEQNNPDIFNQLKQQAENLINNPSPDIRRILSDSHYKNLSKEDMIKEVIATIVGWTSDDVINEHFKGHGIDLGPIRSMTIWDSIKDVVMKFYNWIRMSIGRLFGLNMSDPTLTEQLSSPGLTIESFSKIIVDHVLRQYGPITNYDSKTYGKLTGDQVRKMSALSKEELKNIKIKNINDFTNLLTNTTRPTFKQLSIEDKINYLNVHIDNNRGILSRIYTNDTDIDFNDPKNAAIRETILKDIVNSYSKLNSSLPDQLIKFFN
jgi:hypothetical protein